MGREVKRVDLDFDWYEKTAKPTSLGNKWGETWFGYILDSYTYCALCNGEKKKEQSCRLCYGEGFIHHRIEPPEGKGWQMWENVSEGSPISPVFKTAKALAKWLGENNASAMGSQTATYQEWLGMIKVGSAPSGVISGGRMMTGVEAMARKD